MADRLKQIRERHSEATYATRCAQGAGSFGATEHKMLKDFQEHALDDIEFLLDLLDSYSN